MFEIGVTEVYILPTVADPGTPAQETIYFAFDDIAIDVQLSLPELDNVHEFPKLLEV